MQFLGELLRCKAPEAGAVVSKPVSLVVTTNVKSANE